MIFKIVSTKNAKSYILGHTVKLENSYLKKGKILNKDDISLLVKNKINSIYVAIKSDNDYSENYSAKSIAMHISSNNLYEPEVNNGRADLFSNKNGMLKINKEELLKINSLFPEIAVCTLKNFSIVKKGQLVGNVKILPYAVNKKKIEKILKNKAFKKIFQVSEKSIERVGIIFTSNNKKNLKKEKILQAVNLRLKNFHLQVNFTKVCQHNHKMLSLTINKILKKNIELILIYGETSISDFHDVVPRGIVDSKGKVLSSILPTDPGNLLLIGSILNTVIIGVPGCAKSLKRNGFDDILERVCHGEKFNKIKLAELAEGGLYKNIIRKFKINKDL
tara:strand:+ start:1346 stop:2347 length:1002 start_codon:yes stop_codon:yes gene_type:complete